MAYHKLLERQLKKMTDASLIAHPDCLQFLEAISASYNAYEKDKELSTHAFSLSEQEYTEINEKLKKEINVKKLSVDKLKEAIKEMYVEGDAPGVQRGKSIFGAFMLYGSFITLFIHILNIMGIMRGEE